MQESKDLARQTGIAALGKVPWGTHVCLFYQSKMDLLNVLPPYFKAGLESGELCIWVTSDLLPAGEAENTMRKTMPDSGEYLERGQIEILPHSHWYLRGGSFDMQRVLRGWIGKLNEALTKGYAGIRVSGDTTWLQKRTWKNFVHYEHKVNEVIRQYRMIAICSYCLDKCGAKDIIDVINNHQVGLIKEDGKWALTKNAERIRAEQKAREYQAQLKSLALELALTEEHERQRIASELYDRVSQFLVASKIKLDEFRQSVSGEELGKTLDGICNSLGQAIVQTRSLAIDVSSPVLSELGFERAVADWLSGEIEKRHGIKTEFEDDGQPKLLDNDIQLLLFRFLRELLANAVKHSHAKNIKVSLRRVHSQMRITVEDDGIGFDPTKMQPISEESPKLGLFGIQEKLGHLGGRLEIESKSGHGCKVTMTAPLKL